MPFEIVTVEHNGLLFKIVTMKHKGFPSKIVTMEHKELGIIFFLLVFLNLRKLILNCRTNSIKRMVMTWQLMWLNLSVTTLNATLQLLVILVADLCVAHDNFFLWSCYYFEYFWMYYYLSYIIYVWTIYCRIHDDRRYWSWN